MLFNQNVPSADELSQAVNSADWTGITERLANDQVALALILGEVAKLDRMLAAANLSNADQMQAGPAIDALKLLAHAPQPEWRAIVALLSGPTVSALCNAVTIASVVGAIIKLILN